MASILKNRFSPGLVEAELGVGVDLGVKLRVGVKFGVGVGLIVFFGVGHINCMG